MRVDCEGCAGCCIDWRDVAPPGIDLDHERRGGGVPLDGAYNLVPLTSDEVRAFLRSGLGDAMTPRLFAAARSGTDRTPGTDGTVGANRTAEAGEHPDEPDEDPDEPDEDPDEPDEDPDEPDEDPDERTDEPDERSSRVAAVDGYDLAAIGGRPAFLVGLRSAPKPVGPFGTDPSWLPTCAFLDPETLQCRIHDDDRYPETCATYPGDNLALGRETECERVEAAFGGARLLDHEIDERETRPLRGSGALGASVFAHPAPGELAGRVERVAAGEPTAADRAEFVAVAAASSPGRVEVDPDRRRTAREQVLAADSWVGRAIAEWEQRAGREPPEPGLADGVEERRGAPGTPGWD